MKPCPRIDLVLALLAVGGLAACSSWNTGQTSSSSGAGYAAPALSSATVMQVQTALQQQGFYKGTIDGLWGPETQGALQSYQQAKGLTADGQLGPQTMASLNLSNGGTASTTQPMPSTGTTSSTTTSSTQPMSNGSTTMSQPVTSNGSTQPMTSNGSTQLMSNGSAATTPPMASTPQSTASTTAPKPATATQ